MKEPRNSTSNRGYGFAPDSRPAFRLARKGIDFLTDCDSKLGAIAEDENLPRPTTEKTHAAMVNEEIGLYEQENAKTPVLPQKNSLSKGDKLELLMNCSNRLQSLIDRFFEFYFAASDRDSKTYWWEKLRIAQKANTRVLVKIGRLFVDNQL
jgi:hypothetical protein